MMISNIANSPTVTITTDVDTTSDIVTWIGDYDPAGNSTKFENWKIEPIQYNQYNQYYPYSPIKFSEKELKELGKLLKKENWSIEKIVDKNKTKKKGEFYMMKRLVKVVVVDPDSRVEDKFSVVHMGEAHVTSLADEDLLLEVDLKGALAEHNMVRKKIVDEDRSDKRNKDVYLKAIKVSELEVKVVTIAKF